MTTALSKLMGISFLIIASTAFCFAQTDPNNVPRPPATELKKFEPFLGKYAQMMDYAGLKFSGTLEIKAAVKDWYIERTIRTRTADGKVDREFRAMITYDATMNRYRIWRFETMPALENNEGSGRFEGAEFVEEYEVPTPNGGKGILRNRTTRDSKGNLKIVTEGRDAEGKMIPIGVVTAKRLK